MNKKKDFFEKLIISTIETLNKFKTTNPDLIALTRKPIIDNLWNHICFNLYGNINYINDLNVFTMWQRDTLKYKFERDPFAKKMLFKIDRVLLNKLK